MITVLADCEEPGKREAPQGGIRASLPVPPRKETANPQHFSGISKISLQWTWLRRFGGDVDPLQFEEKNHPTEAVCNALTPSLHNCFCFPRTNRSTSNPTIDLDVSGLYLNVTHGTTKARPMYIAAFEHVARSLDGSSALHTLGQHLRLITRIANSCPTLVWIHMKRSEIDLGCAMHAHKALGMPCPSQRRYRGSRNWGPATRALRVHTKDSKD